MQKEIHEIYKNTIPNVNCVNVKRNYQRPIFAEESYPLVKGGFDDPRLVMTLD